MYVPSLLLPSVFCFCFFTFLRLFFFLTHPAFHTLKNRFFSSILPRILPFSIYRHLFFCNRLVDYQKINCRLFSIVFFFTTKLFLVLSKAFFFDVHLLGDTFTDTYPNSKIQLFVCRYLKLNLGFF